MELAYLTGQRPSDVLKMKIADIYDGCLWVEQNKSKKARKAGQRLGVIIEGRLDVVVKRCVERNAQHPISSMYLLRNKRGQPIISWSLQDWFDKA